MAQTVIMPRQGQSVESCIIVGWKKKKGDTVAEKEILCEVETDKAVFEIEAPVAGTVLEIFYGEGDEVPVLEVIAVIGMPGEKYDIGKLSSTHEKTNEPEAKPTGIHPETGESGKNPNTGEHSQSDVRFHASPRAKKAALKSGVNITMLSGSGPAGRILESDVLADAAGRQPLTPAAAAVIDGKTLPESGSGIGGRIRERDLLAGFTEKKPDDKDTRVSGQMKGVRKVIADNMMKSLSSTAQLTLTSHADASSMLAYREKLKKSGDSDLGKITINDMILYAAAKALAEHPGCNGTVDDNCINLSGPVHLAFAVDTPKGLMVPVIKNAQNLSLSGISSETKRLGPACAEGKILPDELKGGTFTVTNLGSMGIEFFTPILNIPQICILGVGSVRLLPVEREGNVVHLPHIGLSLTFDHRAIDGWPAAKFLNKLGEMISRFDLILAN